jgi:hypothetical protein
MKPAYLVLLSLAVLAARPASAVNLRVDFSGAIDTVIGDLGSLSGSIGVGAQFSGYFTFDDSIAPTIDVAEVTEGMDANVAYADYVFASPGWVFHFEVGDISEDADAPTPWLPTGGHHITVSDQELNPMPWGGSQVGVGAWFAPFPPSRGPDIEFSSVSIGLYSYELGLPLHSTELAAVPWDLTAFPSARIGLNFTRGSEDLLATGAIYELAVTVPEPASAALAALAALALTGLGLARARS